MASSPKNESSESLSDKLKGSIESLRKNEKVEQFYNSATSNTRDTIAYVLLVAGLILMVFNLSWYGSILVGIVFGLYFGGDIISIFKNFEGFIQKQGLVRSVILGGTAIAFLLSAPFVFIGAAIAIGIRQFVQFEKQ